MKYYKHIAAALMLLLLVPLGSCRVKYAFNGASISPLAKTFSVKYFPNNAPMVAPTLSSSLTDALVEKFLRQTRLHQKNEGGDLSMEGEITGYTSVPAAISGGEYASTNRLTVSVRVRFRNTIEPQYNFDKSFSSYIEYDANKLLQQIEPSVIPQLVEMLVEDIFNAAVSNW